MRPKSKVLSYSTLILIASCSTTNLAREKTSFVDFCENGHAKKQHVFILAAYNGIPKGISVASVKSVVESSAGTSDFVKDHFVQALLAYGYSGDPKAPPIKNGVLHSAFSKRFAHGYGPVLKHLAWVKQNKFAVCEGASCDGVKYPETTDKVEFDSQNWNDGRCHDFFMEDEYTSGLGCRGNAFGLLSFMRDSGFNEGWLIANSYLVVPESQKRIVCAAAGQKSDCFNIFDSKDEFYKFREIISSNPSLEADFAFLKSFNGVLEGEAAMLDARSAFTKDLAIKAGTKISTKVANDWTIYRISWDPTPFCQYARPNSDFYTH